MLQHPILKNKQTAGCCRRCCFVYDIVLHYNTETSRFITECQAQIKKQPNNSVGLALLILQIRLRGFPESNEP